MLKFNSLLEPISEYTSLELNCLDYILEIGSEFFDSGGFIDIKIDRFRNISLPIIPLEVHSVKEKAFSWSQPDMDSIIEEGIVEEIFAEILLEYVDDDTHHFSYLVVDETLAFQ